MSSGPAAVVAAGFLVLAGGAAGFVAGRWTAPTSPPIPIEVREPVPAEPPDLAPLLAEIRQGHDEILRALREQPREPAVGQAPPPTVDTERIDRLTAAVGELEARLRAEKGPGHATFAVLQETAQRKMKLIEAGVVPKAEIESELLLAHAKWAQADVVSRYGNPIRILRSSASLILVYEYGDPPEGEIHFWLADDRTTDIRVTPLTR